MDFHVFLNSIDQDFQFTLTASVNRVQYLDTQVYIKDEQIHMYLNIKPTDKNTLLHFASGHLRRMVNSLPFSQMLRVRRIVDKDENMNQALRNMEQSFVNRGYPRSLVKRHADRAKEIPRDNPFNYKTKTGQ